MAKATPVDLSAELWMVRDELRMCNRLLRIMYRDKTLGILNFDDLWRAEGGLADAINRLSSDDVPLPDDFLRPRLALPDRGFAPDYFSHHGYTFASRRLRDAFAQPETVIQFTPVEVVAGGEEVRAQDYRLMRVLTTQPAMDLYLSDCGVHEFVSRIDGQRSMRPDFICQIALLDGLQPRSEIFKIEECPTRLLVTDALAERVLRAKCTGIAFADPTNISFTDKPNRFRGKKGAVMQ